MADLYKLQSLEFYSGFFLLSLWHPQYTVSRLEEWRRLDKWDSSSFYLHTCSVGVRTWASQREPLYGHCKETVTTTTWFIWLRPDNYLEYFPSQNLKLGTSQPCHMNNGGINSQTLLYTTAKSDMENVNFLIMTYCVDFSPSTYLSGKTQVRLLPLQVFIQEFSCSNLQTKFCSTSLVHVRQVKNLGQCAKGN